eukprot:846120-Ditylum_brightwellii.AAC.1
MSRLAMDMEEGNQNDTSNEEDIKNTIEDQATGTTLPVASSDNESMVSLADVVAGHTNGEETASTPIRN